MAFYKKKRKSKDASEYDEARLYSWSVWYLSMGDKPVSVLTEKLEGKTTNASHIEKTINRLIDIGYLDNNRYLESYFRNASENKHYGLMRVRQELKQKGLSSQEIEEGLNAADIDWINVCRLLIVKKYGSLSGDHKEKQKQLAFLARRGFSFGEIQSAELRLIEDQNSE